MEVERLRKEEEAACVAGVREQLEQTVRSLERQLAAKQDEVQSLQVSSCRITAEDRGRGLHKLFGTGPSIWNIYLTLKTAKQLK